MAALNSTQITTLLSIAQASITFLISLRAFSRYFKTHHDLHFILGVAMGTIAVVGVIGIIGDNYLASFFSTKWFRYAAQIVSYFFIFLATLSTAERYLRRVAQWQLISVNYMRFFLQKGTRFSFLMGLSFLLIAVGIAITTPWYYEQTGLIYLYVGDTTRTVGLLTLLLTFLIG